MKVLGELSFPVPRVPITLDKLESITELWYIPLRLHPQIFETFFDGYQYMFKIIMNALDSPRINSNFRDMGLNREDPLGAIFQQLPGSTYYAFSRMISYHFRFFNDQKLQFYLNKCGKVSEAILYTLDAVTANARDKSSLGDGMFEKLMIWEGTSDETWNSLTHCANDLDFDLVHHQLGLSAHIKWGPCYANGHWGAQKTFMPPFDPMLFGEDSEDDEDGDSDGEDDDDEDEEDGQMDEGSEEEYVRMRVDQCVLKG
jgi:hypothetical protein